MSAAAQTIASTAPVRRGSLQRSRRWALLWSYVFLVLFAIFFLMPPIYMLIMGLKTSNEIAAVTNPWWVYHPTLENFKALLTSTQYLTFFRNSAVIAVAVVIITMLIAVPAAFSLGRMRFWGSTTLATGVFLTYLIPDSLLFIPLFKIMAWVHETTGVALLNHWWALIIIYPTLTVPFATWIMIGYFQSIPKELDEAALIDGANWWQKVWYVTLPMMRNIIAITMLFSLIVTFANFDIVRILTAGGPVDSTHIFATWAFALGIQGNNIPMGASVSLFMLPILGVAAFFILRDITKRGSSV